MATSQFQRTSKPPASLLFFRSLCKKKFTKNKQFQINIKIVLNSSFHGMKDTRYEGC